MPDAPLLRLRQLGVRYGATRALEGVDLEVRPGTVHALVGENGAGKSTLLRALFGLVRRASGAGEVLGQPGLPRSPAEAEARRLGFAPQELALCPDLRVSEQLALGHEPRGRSGAVARRAEHERALRLLGHVGAALDPGARVASLRAPERKLVQIARALATDPFVLLLDEPTAALDAPSAARVVRLARAWARQGRAVVWVSHQVEDVLAHADVVTVLRDGRCVSTTPAAALDAAALLRRMVGRDLPPRAGAPASAASPVPVCTLPPPIGMPLHAGEVLGLFGLVGAGRSRALETLARRLPEAALVPEERGAKGLVPTFRLRENLFLPAPHRWLRIRRERRAASAWIARLRIRAPGPDAPIEALSGGNQQKVLLARSLARHPRILLLDEPTQGVDVGAKAEIHALVRALAAEGTAIVLSSSDLPELLGLAHRIGVLRDGVLAGVLEGAAAGEEALLALACGVAA